MWTVVEAYFFNVIIGEIPSLGIFTWLFDDGSPMQFDDASYMESDG